MSVRFIKDINSSNKFRFLRGLNASQKIKFLKAIIIPNPTVPTSTGSAGARGQISWDDDFIYVCVSGNSWKRSALTTW